MILDSDILIDFLKKEKNVVERLTGMDSQLFSITSINSFELFRGLTKNDLLEESKVSLFLKNFNVIDFDYESSQKAAEIFNFLSSKGEIIELPDIMIAAICIENQEPLLTKNTKHFSRIPELKLEKI